MSDLEANVAGKLKSYEREIKELNMLLFPEVSPRVKSRNDLGLANA